MKLTKRQKRAALEVFGVWRKDGVTLTILGEDAFRLPGGLVGGIGGTFASTKIWPLSEVAALYVVRSGMGAKP